MFIFFFPSVGHLRVVDAYQPSVPNTPAPRLRVVRGFRLDKVSNLLSNYINHHLYHMALMRS